MSGSLALIALVALGVYFYLHTTSGMASSSGTPASTSTGSSSASGTSTGTPIPSGGTIPTTNTPPPPPNPLQTGVPIQHAGKIAGLYTILSGLNPPGFLQTAAGWNQGLYAAWQSYSFATGDLSSPLQPDPMQVFGPVVQGYDGTQKMDLPTYWAGVSVWLKGQGLSGWQGLSGKGDWWV